MDDFTTLNAQNMRIDTRILKHLLGEAMELLEEAQTHALVEKQGEATSNVLASASWRMTATCLWAVGELMPTPGDLDQSAQLHAPAPVFSCTDDKTLSTQLAAFATRVNRLHERARRLDELSRGPVVSTDETLEQSATPETAPAQDAPTQAAPAHSATVVPLFAATGGAAAAKGDPVGQVRGQVRRAMGRRD